MKKRKADKNISVCIRDGDDFSIDVKVSKDSTAPSLDAGALQGVMRQWPAELAGPGKTAPRGGPRSKDTGSSLFEYLMQPPEQKDDSFSNTSEEHEYIKTLPARERGELRELFCQCSSSGVSTPVKYRVLRSRLPVKLKKKIIAKINKNNDSSSTDNKYLQWVEYMISVPLGIYSAPTFVSSDKLGAIKTAAELLDSVVHGHRNVKQVMVEYLCSWMNNPKIKLKPLGLVGGAGTGKTTIVKEGLSRIFNRPFSLVPMGGVVDSAFLLGHSFTYEGSMPGRVVDELAKAECMNPVVFMDELDKISKTPKGDEILNCLLHITDHSQNSGFQDKYLNGLDIDISDVLFVFSMNDTSNVNPVLLDRLALVHMDELTKEDLVVITNKYVIPKSLAKHDFSGKIVFEPDGIAHLTQHVKSVRTIGDVIDSIVRKVKLYEDTATFDFTYPLSKKCIVSRPDGYVVTLDSFLAIIRETCENLHHRMYI